MSYGQKSYNELQGRVVNGVQPKYRIAQIGCFISAFCNLLERFGEGGMDPVGMNAALRDNGLYTDIDDHVFDDVGYATISQLRPEIVVTHTGAGGWPDTNDAIVKFYFKGSAGFTTHFCLVADHNAKTIVDSWDGQVKSAAQYGEPIGWAAYAINRPQPAAPAPAAANPDMFVVPAGYGISQCLKVRGYPDFGDLTRWNWLAKLNGHDDYTTFRLKPGQEIVCPSYQPSSPPPAPQPAPESDVIGITVQPGWGITHVLQAAGYSQAQYEREEEWDRVARLNGSATRLRLQPGEVVEVNRTPLPEPSAVAAPAAQAEPAPAEAVTPVAPDTDGGNFIDPDDWKTIDPTEAGEYIANETVQVHDLDGDKLPLLTLPDGTKFHVAGTVHPKGVKYYVSQRHANRLQFYGIPEFIAGEKTLRKADQPDPKDDDSDLEQIMSEIYVGRQSHKKDNISLSSELSEFRSNLTKRETIVAIVAKIIGAISKIKFWQKRKTLWNK
jgi:hypothetical protein